MASDGTQELYCTPPRPEITKNGLAIPPTPFLRCLGVGTGVNVWEFKNTGVRSPWAMKNVRRTAGESTQRYESLISKEAEVLADITHENIIGYRGLIKSIDGRQCLAMESFGVSLGDLTEQREDDGGPIFTPREINIVVVSIGKALDYLHSQKNLLHGDIKPYNILVKGKFEAVKLCDFGVCVRLNKEGIADYYTGTTIYNAPEVVDEFSTDPITAKSEIFSLGLVIWGMLTLKPPHCEQFDSEASGEDSISILDESQLSNLSISRSTTTGPGTRPHLPNGFGPEYNQIKELFLKCTELKPEDRPTAAQVVDALTPKT